MTSRARLLILVFALAGLAFAGSSAYVHYRLVTQPAYVSPCDINATFNCSQVYLSQYGAIRGVPVAVGGLIWFGLVTLLAAFARPEQKGDPSGAYIFALATVGLGAIIYLGYASFFVLKTGCVLCIGTYVSVLGIFFVSSASVSMPMTRLPGRLFGDLRTLVSRPTTMLVAILFLAGAASAIAFFPKEGSARSEPAPTPQEAANMDKAFADAWFKQNRVDIGVPANGAKVLIVKFIDWQCPSCKAAHFAYKPLLDEFEKTNPGAGATGHQGLPAEQPMQLRRLERDAPGRLRRSRGHASGAREGQGRGASGVDVRDAERAAGATHARHGQDAGRGSPRGQRL